MSCAVFNLRHPVLLRDSSAGSPADGYEQGIKQHRSPSVTNGTFRLDALCRQNRLLRSDSGILCISNRFRAMGISSSASKGATVINPVALDGTSEQTNYKAISESEWKRRLTHEQFNVARKKGTERPFTGEFWNTKTAGAYLCVCCQTPLFDSATKFDSGTGWPSYWQPIGDNVKSESDWSIPFMPRTEVLCAKCDAHLGHVFDDGPPPTRQRYCINSASLSFKPAQNGN